MPSPSGPSTRSVTAGQAGLVIAEDEHLLVVNKPAGMNTHSPSPFAGEGIYEWLRNRESRWAELAIVHRLDKETSGVMIFGKTTLANKSLTEQFSAHTASKHYLLRTDCPVRERQAVVESAIVRLGERYVSRPLHAGADRAETRFQVLTQEHGITLVRAEPVTGRTHQIRVHAAEQGFPILGDSLYGGNKWPRVCLHAESISLRHPATGEPITFCAPVDFEGDSRQTLRAAFVDPAQTDACRLIHGASDGWPGWYVERLGEFLLSQSEHDLGEDQKKWLNSVPRIRGVYHKRLDRHVRKSSVPAASSELAIGERAQERFMIRENGIHYELSFQEGYSVGLFLDQRDNRRRFLVNHIAAGFPLFTGNARGREILNAFAYTCGFSVCAAKAGARTTSLDLSKKYLDWGRRNFELNDLNPAEHDFIYGDVFDWFRRLAKKQRAFDAIVLDPPTFSQSKENGVFRAEKDYGKLVTAALPLLKPDGVLLASTNAATLEPERFLEMIHDTARAQRRRIVQEHYVPQPPDFPVSRAEPAYLKTAWLRLA